MENHLQDASSTRDDACEAGTLPKESADTVATSPKNFATPKSAADPFRRASSSKVLFGYDGMDAGAKAEDPAIRSDKMRFFMLVMVVSTVL